MCKKRYSEISFSAKSIVYTFRAYNITIHKICFKSKYNSQILWFIGSRSPINKLRFRMRYFISEADIIINCFCIESKIIK